MRPSGTPAPRGFARILGARRVRVTLGGCLVASLILWHNAKTSYPLLIGRLMFVGMIELLVFGLFERWPARLPRWLARWALQVVGVAVAVPLAVFLAYVVTSLGDPPFWHDKERMAGYANMASFSLILAPWIAVSARVQQINGAARSQALAFELERSELERKALDARLRLLQAQVEPHFLFNTLANVRELVDSGSPQASTVLGSLIAYLRAAVPRLHEPATTLGQELELVRAYLEVMHMRMPDRMAYALHVDEATLTLHCPPMTLLTLVENAVRHGIDPSEDGGRIEIRVVERDGRCRAQVVDTGVGLRRHGRSGLGTGLSTLRERLQLTFGESVQLRLDALAPHGVSAELEFPARRSPA
ncbi:MAG: sensor histidine kinase [Deltaproteobacteria bacterium]|nr:MAG: sensor histidine kinase [Deltaproteobacteria bacterium]